MSLKPPRREPTRRCYLKGAPNFVPAYLHLTSKKYLAFLSVSAPSRFLLLRCFFFNLAIVCPLTHVHTNHTSPRHPHMKLSFFPFKREGKNIQPRIEPRNAATQGAPGMVLHHTMKVAIRALSAPTAADAGNINLSTYSFVVNWNRVVTD